MAELIVAVFDNESHLTAAVRDLESAGIPSSAIRQYRRGEAPASVQNLASATGAHTSATSTSSSTTTSSSGGFWSWLMGEEGTSSHSDRYADDARLYDSRAASGNSILSVTLADDTHTNRVMDILEAHEPLGLEERETSATETTGTSSATTAGRMAGTTAATPGVPGVGATPTGTTGMRTGTERTTEAGRDETIQLAEEQLEVGKRTVDRGTTRIRRYVVEKPVEAEVTLHGEKVTIERRKPVAGSAGPVAGAFEERTIEVKQTEEVPVVGKTTRVAEEVLVHREATERTEKVQDTVRREEIEVTEANKTDPTTKSPDR